MLTEAGPGLGAAPARTRIGRQTGRARAFRRVLPWVEAVGAAMDNAKIDQGPGGGAEMVPGKMHCKMNMYIAQCKVDAGKTRYDVISSDKMVDPKEC